MAEFDSKAGFLLIQKPSLFASWMRCVILPSAKEGAYPVSVRIILTVLMFVGLSMLFSSPFFKPIAGSKLNIILNSPTVFPETHVSKARFVSRLVASSP